MSNYRWIKDVEFIRHGTQSDPELKYDWVVANYREVEDWLYDNFIDELNDKGMFELYKWFTEIDRDSCFDWRLSQNKWLLWDIFSQVKK